jgi:aryl-alcohol dehydrogenase-like predicted oxidoreductase
MKTVRLGKTGLNGSRIGLGGLLVRLKACEKERAR